MDDDERNIENLPIFRKGKEIFDVINRICDLIPDSDKHLQSIKGMMIGDAALLSVKVAGAESGGLYDLKMQNAAIIRQAALDLMIQNHSLEAFGFKEVRYYQIVRDLIDDYRLLFIEWVAGFDKFNYVVDRWGLFNPPGVSPFDKDVDDFSE